MPITETVTLRVSLLHEKAIFRDIEIEASKSLYNLAKAIVAAFGFDFDHAFGFYSELSRAAMPRKLPRYELFADMGEADPGVLGVKNTKITQAFPVAGHTMLFLFDYGDDWRFRVSVQAKGTKIAKVRYPRVVAAGGEAPLQYPDPEEAEDDGPTWGVNPVTGERILLVPSKKAG
jgi:hypothetical protein